MVYRPWTMDQKKPIPKIRNGGVFKHEKKSLISGRVSLVRFKRTYEDLIIQMDTQIDNSFFASAIPNMW